MRSTSARPGRRLRTLGLVAATALGIALLGTQESFAQG